MFVDLGEPQSFRLGKPTVPLGLVKTLGPRWTYSPGLVTLVKTLGSRWTYSPGLVTLVET